MLTSSYKYINGNYLVTYDKYNYKLTKRAFRFNEDFQPDFPDSLDLKITNKCSWGCPWCHEKSTNNGKSFSLERTKEILSQLPKGIPIEIAIGGGNVLEIPEETLNLVNWMTSYGFLPRITINYKDIKSRWNVEVDKSINELIYTIPYLGISLDSMPDDINEFSDFYGSNFNWNLMFDSEDYEKNHQEEKKYDPMFFARNTIGSNKVVFHIIAGIFPFDEIKNLMDRFPRRSILILGYKQWGRAFGTKLPDSLPEFEKEVGSIISSSSYEKCKVIGFDNLALDQLHIKDKVSPRLWESLYMGDEGSHSMYIDAVNGEYAINSRSSDRVSWDDVGLIEYFKSLQK